MKRKIKDLRHYDLIVCSNSPNATVWRVMEIDGNRVKIIDASLTYAFPNIAQQENDISLFKRPTKAQLDKFNASQE